MLSALAACGGSAEGASDGGDAVVLRAGQLGTVELNKALLEASGQDEGLDYEIEWTLFPGGPALSEASGSVDVGQMADTPPIFGQVSNAPIKVVAAGYGFDPAEESQVKILAAADSPIEDAADLEGKKVAIFEGTILQYTVVKALEEVGLSYADITPVNLEPSEAATAFQSGDVDAVAALDPQLAMLEAAGAKVVADGVGTTSGLSYIVATDEALAEKEEAVLDFAVRLQKAQLWANDHKEEWAADYAELTGLPRPVAEAIIDRQQFTPTPIDEDVYRWQQEQADAYADLGLIPELDVTAEFDDRFNDDLAGVR